jgi:hypothetical protein
MEASKEHPTSPATTTQASHQSDIKTSMTLSKQLTINNSEVIGIPTTDTKKHPLRADTIEELIEQQQTSLSPTKLPEIEQAVDASIGIVVYDTPDNTEVSTIQPTTLETTIKATIVALIQNNDDPVVQASTEDTVDTTSADRSRISRHTHVQRPRFSGSIR